MSNVTQYIYKELFEIRYWKGSHAKDCYEAKITFLPLGTYNDHITYLQNENEAKSHLEKLCDNYNIKFRTWMVENDFEFISPEDYKKVGCNYYHYWGEYGKGTEEFYKDHYGIVKNKEEKK